MGKKKLNKLPKKEYIILNDIMLESNNTTHQIDHIVISKYGIFVIEMKNYHGLILGNEYQDKWFQYLGKKKSFFENPIHQNYGHIKSLEEVLKLNEDIFTSIVCFSNQAKLKVESKSIVTQVNFLNKKIKEFNTVKIFDNLIELADKINKLNIKDKQIRKQHIKNIKLRIKMDNEKANNMICPKCGNKLIMKSSEYGNFIGCSNFPKCKYKRKINMKEHTHYGVYGLIIKDNQIALINKVSGPYDGKLDLPGGSIEFGEKPEQTLKREIKEELGIDIISSQLIDTDSITFKWTYNNQLINWQHIGIFYKITSYNGEIKNKIELTNQNNDSLGGDFYDINSLKKDQLSELTILILEKLGYILK